MSGFLDKVVEVLIKQGGKTIGRKLDEAHRESINSFNIGVNYYNKGYVLLEEGLKKRLKGSL